jgi:hypothetical protein
MSSIQSPPQSTCRSNKLKRASGSHRLVFEGGFRVPAMIRWPGKIKPGTRSRRAYRLLRLEQTRQSALERHVYRLARLGSWVLISETWYNMTFVRECVRGQRLRSKLISGA